ncbi:MAG: tRNA (adenosine(37)-N6)-dimethylallyltransferase MiaA [Gammaproteobacteria bacterium]|nr:MAG: tRNA (adenosine(37)-N6)-dimethylallyltransferase MiaA [Gammaproteobacteria bacterium]
MSEEPLLFLTGPTAAGKTALSIDLARALDAEIISVDSALVYRRMDIGTAKPDLGERGGVPHHLIDVREPRDTYSAASFRDDAVALVRAIEARGRRALFVGGTMLYWRALVVGLAALPDADPAIRAELVARAEKEGWGTLHAMLAECDPEAAARIHPNDPQRLQRALEVYMITGRPLSEWQQHTRAALARDHRVLALVPDERRWLHERIAQRLAAMDAAGFVDEVRALLAEPGITPELPALKSVGYRQVATWLRGEAETWLPEACAATRQLAKRQLTWLRSSKQVSVFSCDTLSRKALSRAVCEKAMRALRF